MGYLIENICSHTDDWKIFMDSANQLLNPLIGRKIQIPTGMYRTRPTQSRAYSLTQKHTLESSM